MSQIIIPQATKKIYDVSKQLQEQSLGYNFTGLLTGLVFIFIFAKLIEAYVSITTGATSAWLGIIKTFGFNVPTNAPNAIVSLVQTGFGGIKYWDMIKGLMILIIGLEWMKADKSKQLSYAGHAAFGLIMGFFALITFPSLVQRLKEIQVLKA